MADDLLAGVLLNDHSYALSSDKYVDTRNGQIDDIANLSLNDGVTLEDGVEVVVGVDEVDINFEVRSSEAVSRASSGFLVEVFLSSSDGILTKMNKNDTLNPETGTVQEEGFVRYFVLTVK